LRDITSRKKAEQALRESEERFRAAFEQAAVGIAIASLDGRLLEMNAKAVELFGYTTPELQRRTFLDVTHPDDLAATGENVRRLLGGETRSYAMEKRYVRRDRSVVWSMSTVTLLKSAEGAPDKMIGILEDITPRKHAEDALRASETFNRTIIESSRDCIKTLTLDGVLLWISEAGRKAMCVPDLSDVVGKSYVDFWGGEDREAARAAVGTAAGGGTGNFVGHFPVAGKSRWWDVVVTPIRDASSRPEKLLAVSRDVTDRREAAEALRENEAVLRVVTNESQVGLVLVNAERRYLFANATYTRILGLGSEPVIGKRVAEVLPNLYEQIGPRLDRAFAGERVAYELRTPSGNGGEERFHEVICEPRKAGTADAYVVVVLVDITRRKQAEEAVKRREEELRAMADSIPQLAWMAQPDGHIFWYNRGWFDYTGTTLEQMQGWGWQSVHDPTILPKVIEQWRASIDTGGPFEMEFPLRGADGVFRWFLTRVNPLRDSEGRVVRWFGTNTNVDDVRRAREALREETRILELLNETGTAIASKLDLQSLVQTVTDAATQLSGAKFGAFFYNVVNEKGEALLLYTLSGAPREAFERFGVPRNTPVFHPTFHNTGIVRSADITKDPRYGTMAPHHGMPRGHLPVRSYLAVPVVSRSGEVIGGLFFGHPEPDVFKERAERLIAGVAAQAAIAIDNARSSAARIARCKRPWHVGI
jgi:PAS domain S-box-containing protein